MSLYNMLFGVHGHAAELLQILSLDPGDIPRFRSCYWNGAHIVVHTRTGGGNREYYESEESCRENYPEYFEGDTPPSGPWNEDLRAVPGYVRDEDCYHDSTYADFFFEPPAAVLEALKALPADVTPGQQWEAAMAALNAAKVPR